MIVVATTPFRCHCFFFIESQQLTYFKIFLNRSTNVKELMGVKHTLKSFSLKLHGKWNYP